MVVTGAGVSMTVKVKHDFTPITRLALDWFQLSNGNWRATDRGATADVYQADTRLYGVEAEINAFIAGFESNRQYNSVNSNTVNLSNFASNEFIFGCDVDHTIPISATLLEIGSRGQRTWKGYEIRAKFQALIISFLGNPILPALSYLDIGYHGDNKVEIKKLDNYSGDFFYQDHSGESGIFRGEFLLSGTDMRTLRRYIATRRAATIPISGIAGVAYPFGLRRGGSYPYNVKIIDWEDLGMRDVDNWKIKLTLAEEV